MSKKSLLTLLAIAIFAAAVATGLGASAAFAGEVTGNCNHAKPESKAADNCGPTPIGVPGETDPPHAASICSFSGQNDGVPPAGRKAEHVQSWGQEADRDELPAFLHPGNSCNGHTGFFAGG